METSGSGADIARRAPGAGLLIDVHHHFNPTFQDAEGNPWSIAMAVDQMDRCSIAAAVASLGPVHAIPPAERRRTVRGWNEWATTLCTDHPGRFGLFAALPLHDIDGSLAEIAHAYDVLQADGIGLSTNEGDIWLGDERNWPVLAELDRRKAVIFVHPAATSRCGPLSRDYGGPAVSPPWIEFPVNTARCILGLVAQGVTRRFPGIRFIFAHGGGVMPILLGRIAGFSGWRTVGTDRLRTLFPDGPHAEFGKFYFDCAQAYAPEAFAMMRRIVPDSHLLFGSDFSYFDIAHSVDQLHGLGLDDGTLRAVGSSNAAALFPRFAAAR